MNFDAEIIEVKSKKTASLDISYRVVLQTSDPAVLALAAMSPETLVRVEVKPTNG